MARDWDADRYHRISAPQFAWGKAIIDGLVLRGDETVLDLGAGSGRLTALLLERLPRGHVVALDRTASMIERARQELSARFGSRVSFLLVDALELTERARFDLVFSTATFHWILDHDRLFARVHQALKPGGQLVAQCGGGANLERLRDRARALMAGPQLRPYFADWAEPWLYADVPHTEARLARAGFSQISVELRSAPTPFSSREAFREFAETVVLGAHVQRIGDAQARSDFVDALVDAAAQDDPPFCLDYWRLNLRATA